MISPSELQGVIDDIRRVGSAARLDPAAHYSEDDDDQSENHFLPRAYDIDRLHADDARDKVFVAILKALVARNNKPSSPKELATCIMRREFTMLGGATPYATVSSRISQHFKRILEHIPPRPPILGRVAHEKHTRKYFYYVASAAEQEDFLRKVRVGIIPINSNNGVTTSYTGNGDTAGSGSKKPRSAKKVRCMVPAVAVELDLFPSTAIRRTRRAASADITSDSVGTSTMSSHEDSSAVPSRSSASGANARPRRTSYDSGNLTRDSSADEHNEIDYDSNPYARKRYKSVRSIVAQAYPRRRSRRQSGLGSSMADSVVASLASPQTRRSASHNDAAGGDSGPGSGVRRTSSGAGKWRPNCQSGDDEGDDEHSMHTKYESDGSDDKADTAPSDGEDISGYYDHNTTRAETLVASRDDKGSSDSVPLPTGAADERRRTALSVDIKSFAPPPPNTTPRASASPDRTPYPPATSPSLHSLRRFKANNVTVSGVTPRDVHVTTTTRHQCSSSGELQIASPLLLPRGMISLPHDGSSIFGASPITEAALNVEPIAISNSSISPAASLRHCTSTPVSTSTLEGMQTDETHVDTAEDDPLYDYERRDDKTGICIEKSVFEGDDRLPEGDQKQPLSATTTTASVVSVVALTTHDTIEKAEPLTHECGECVPLLSVNTEQQSIPDSGDMDISSGSGNGGFDFSFHDLMDAELMSLNELDTLWTNSNPTSDSYLDSGSFACHSMLDPIPEAIAEDGSDAAVGDDVPRRPSTNTNTSSTSTDYKGIAPVAVSASVCSHTVTSEAATSRNENDCSKLSAKLTRKLLALQSTSPAVSEQIENVVNYTASYDACHPLAEQEAVHNGLSADKQDVKYTAGITAASPSLAKSEDSSSGEDLKKPDLDSVEPTTVLVKNAKEHEETVSASTCASSNRVVLPDPFADISPTAMVATKVPVSPRIVLTIVETVPVYMTVITTTEPAAERQGKWIVRRHRLLRLVENGYVNASSLLLAGGVASEQERSIVLSLEVGRFKWRRPQSKLYGTWIPLPRARALAATCSLNHRLGPFLNDNLESYFPAPLPTSFIRHLIMPFFNDSASILLSPSQPDGINDSSSTAGLVNDADGMLAKAALTPTPSVPLVPAAAVAEAKGESELKTESDSVTITVAAVSKDEVATGVSASATGGIAASASSLHPDVTANTHFASNSSATKSSGSTAAAAAHSHQRQPKQSISRLSTFGATARGTPSPSIIQSLAARGGGSLNFAGAAKAIFGSDDRQLQSFLQLLSAESPMLGTSSIVSESPQTDHTPPRPESPLPPSLVSADAAAMDEGAAITTVVEAPTNPSASASLESEKRVVDRKTDGSAGIADDASLPSSPFGTRAGVKAVTSDLAKSTIVDNATSVDMPARNEKDEKDEKDSQMGGEKEEASDAGMTAIDGNVAYIRGGECVDKDKSTETTSIDKPIVTSDSAATITAAATRQVSTARSSVAVDGLNDADPGSTQSSPDTNATAHVKSDSGSHVVASEKKEQNAETEDVLSSGAQFGDSMDIDLDLDSAGHEDDDDLDLRLVFSTDDDDMDMICRSTPPSPPPPPRTPPRHRRLSSTPLLISRSVSPCLSESVSSTGDHGHRVDQELAKQHQVYQDQKAQQQYQQQIVQRLRRDRQQQHGIGSFNARLAQSMEAFGFTGTDKASLLLRLRAAAAAKSTGRQQAVAPYMLYRSNANVAGAGIGAGGSVGIASAGAGCNSGGGGADGGSKRPKGDADGFGVRKRARVMRVARAKPQPKQAAAVTGAEPSASQTAAAAASASNKGAIGVRGRSKGAPAGASSALAAPNASVVLRLASAIYNHTLNLTALAQSQRQAAEAQHSAGQQQTQASASAGSSVRKDSTVTAAARYNNSGQGGTQRRPPLPPQGNASASVSGSRSVVGSQPRTPVKMGSPSSGRPPITPTATGSTGSATPPTGRPLPKPMPRPPPQHQRPPPFAGNNRIAAAGPSPRSPAQQRPSPQRPAAMQPGAARPPATGNPGGRPMQPPARGGQPPMRPANGGRSPSMAAHARQMPSPGLPQQSRQRPLGMAGPGGARPSLGPPRRPPGPIQQQQQRPPGGASTASTPHQRLPQPQPPLLRSNNGSTAQRTGAAGSPIQQQQKPSQKQQQQASSSAATAVVSSAAPIGGTTKTRETQKAA
ncbi:hypothetical protein IWW48_000880 [Coemansia sp. RSA 1200]|nr:hypothetical protein IWW48_000880 [Coemansia sp. RSA 1200]